VKTKHLQVDVMLLMRVSRNNLTLAAKILFKLARDDLNDHQVKKWFNGS
jgi:hypothetical protein